MREPTPEQKKFIEQYLDPDGEIEVPKPLLDSLTSREVAEVDQLLAARFDLARALSEGKGALVARSVVRNVVRLDLLLRSARERIDRYNASGEA